MMSSSNVGGTGDRAATEAGVGSESGGGGGVMPHKPLEPLLKQSEGSSEGDTAVARAVPTKTLDDILGSMELGAFHWRLVVICGLTFMADAMEVSLLGFLSECAGADWGLSDAQTSSITSVVFAGELVGCFCLGPMADKWGRRKIFILSCVVMTVAGVISALSPNYAFLMVFRALVGWGVGGISVPFDLLEHRGKVLLMIEYWWTVGSMFVAGMAWAILSTSGDNGWRILTVVCSLPVLSSLASTYWLPESPRWLISQGRTHDAEQVLRDAARVNGTDLGDFKLFNPFVDEDMIAEDLGPGVSSSAATGAADAAKMAANGNKPRRRETADSDLGNSANSVHPGVQQLEDDGASQHSAAITVATSGSGATTTTRDARDGSGAPASTLEVSSLDDDEEGSHHRGDDSDLPPLLLQGNANSSSSSGAHPHGAGPNRHALAEDMEEGGFMELLAPNVRKTTLLLWVIWIGFGCGYYGLILFVARLFSHSSDDDDGDDDDGDSCSFKYAEIFISACSEVLGITLAVGIIDRIGRRYTQFYLYTACAISTVFLGFRFQTWVLTVFATVARLCVMGASCATWVNTPELYATRIRGTGHSAANGVARLGAFASPFVAESSSVPILVSALTLAACNGIAGLAAVSIPAETAGAELIDFQDDLSNRPQNLQATNQNRQPHTAAGSEERLSNEHSLNP